MYWDTRLTVFFFNNIIYFRENNTLEGSLDCKLKVLKLRATILNFRAFHCPESQMRHIWVGNVAGCVNALLRMGIH